MDGSTNTRSVSDRLLMSPELEVIGSGTSEQALAGSGYD